MDNILKLVTPHHRLSVAIVSYPDAVQIPVGVRSKIFVT
jgi:hypothetical protein